MVVCAHGRAGAVLLFTAFVYAYGTGTLKVPRDFLLSAVLAASMPSFVAIPLFGHLSDQFGRKRIYMLGALMRSRTFSGMRFQM